MSYPVSISAEEYAWKIILKMATVSRSVWWSFLELFLPCFTIFISEESLKILQTEFRKPNQDSAALGRYFGQM